MQTYSDDIGRCYDCLSEEGQRHSRTRVVTLARITPDTSEEARIVVWLCDDCSEFDNQVPL